MKVAAGATLNINGTQNDQVIIRGDRNDPYYDTIPKNWNSIRMEAGSLLNMNHTRLFGGTKGLDLKQAPLQSKTHLFIRFRIMEFML